LLGDADMTEAEWLTCTDPDPMLDFLGEGASLRKHRLFAVACCRRVWPLLPSARGRLWVEIAEFLADGRPVEGDLEAERHEHWEAFQHIDGFRRERENNIRWHALLAAQGAIQDADTFLGKRGVRRELLRPHYHAAWAVAHWHRPGDTVEYNQQHLADELARQAPLLRDIFGNTFCPVVLDPALLTTAVVSLARAAYEERALPTGELDRTRLTVLADALEEAGCTQQAMLDHLRRPGPHVRGCWPVDLILAKE
jgi:hypothetical protein